MADISSNLPCLLVPKHAPPAESPSPEVEAADFAFQAIASSPQSLKETQRPEHEDDAHRRQSQHSEQLFSSPPAPPLNEFKRDDSYNYNFSGTVYDETSGSASNTDHEHDALSTTDEDAALGKESHLRGSGDVSSRSSISSLPASVMVDRKAGGYSGDLLSDILDVHVHDTPTNESRAIHHDRSGSLAYKAKSPGSGSAHSGVTEVIHPRSGKLSCSGGTVMEFSPAFRKASSVRAMQMRDESVFNDDGDDEVEELGRRSVSTMHRRRGSRMSVLSHRSSGSTQSSPTKRGRSGGSPLKNSRTEFPLVLLHCTLLPITLGCLVLQGQLEDNNLLKEVLPPVYWRRWRMLQEKVIDNVEVKERGVLIPHPRGDYENLEERLLESLELERPRLREGHFLRKEHEGGHKSELDEQEVDTDSTTMSKIQCPDCGSNVSMATEQEKKYEVKVYAANGLMRAAAWSAAWHDMEKIDVEVGVWMPEEVRRSVEERLGELGATGAYEMETDEDADEVDEEERRRREVYGDERRQTQGQAKSDSVFENDMTDSGLHEQAPDQAMPRPASLQDLLLSCWKYVLDDRRNLLIVLLSVLILFYAMGKPFSTKPAPFESEPRKMDLQGVVKSDSSPVVEIPTLTVTATSTAVAVSTVTVSESCVAEAREFEVVDLTEHEVLPVSESTPESSVPSSDASQLTEPGAVTRD